jgi:hypothetical protein
MNVRLVPYCSSRALRIELQTFIGTDKCTIRIRLFCVLYILIFSYMFWRNRHLVAYIVHLQGVNSGVRYVHLSRMKWEDFNIIIIISSSSSCHLYTGCVQVGYIPGTNGICHSYSVFTMYGTRNVYFPWPTSCRSRVGLVEGMWQKRIVTCLKVLGWEAWGKPAVVGTSFSLP